tara:strand:+ start:81 stop:989 length:909 start_codon:yes stop_codon:yes gene_type:complete
MANRDAGKIALLAAFLGNTSITCLKSVAAWVTGSTAMMAEAIHSLADATNQVLLYVGMRRSERPADSKHPFGYGKESYFWAFLVSIMIFAGGATYSMYEGIHRLIDPVESQGSRTWAYAVLSGSILFEAAACYFAMKAFQQDAAGRGIWETVKRAKDPVLFTVLFEDLAALAGLVIALLGIGLADVTNNSRFDAGATVTIGVLLAFVAITLGKKIHSLLLGEGADRDLVLSINQILDSSPHIQETLELRTLQMGPASIFVMAELRMQTKESIEQVATILENIERQIEALNPGIKKVYLEPEP